MGYNFPTFLISFQAKKQYLVLLKNTMAISITNISILQYVLPGLCHHVCYVWRRSAFLIFFCSKLKKKIYILLEIPNSSLFFWRYIWYWYITPPPTDPNWTSSTRCQRLQMPEDWSTCWPYQVLYNYSTQTPGKCLLVQNPFLLIPLYITIFT